MIWRKKKFIFSLLAAVLVISASIGGVALAQESGEESQPKTLMARVAEKLGVDQQALEDAFVQARTEMREEALDSYLQKLVDEGRITEEEATQYKEWLQARPDMGPFMDELKDWLEIKPDIPEVFGFRGFRNFGGFHGMGGMRIFGGRCLPAE